MRYPLITSFVMYCVTVFVAWLHRCFASLCRCLLLLSLRWIDVVRVICPTWSSEMNVMLLYASLILYILCRMIMSCTCMLMRFMTQCNVLALQLFRLVTMICMLYICTYTYILVCVSVNMTTSVVYAFFLIAWRMRLCCYLISTYVCLLLLMITLKINSFSAVHARRLLTLWTIDCNPCVYWLPIVMMCPRWHEAGD
jgi:hypothetical protein